MTTAPNRISVLATQIAHTDRRALSQAWYDALYGGPKQSPTVAKRPEFHNAAEQEHGHGVSAAGSRSAGAVVASSRRGPRAKGVGGAQAGPERPSTRLFNLAGGRTVRAAARLAAASRVVACTVHVDHARVRLLVRTSSGVTQIFAICAPADRERVARALAGAGFVVAA